MAKKAPEKQNHPIKAIPTPPSANHYTTLGLFQDFYKDAIKVCVTLQSTPPKPLQSYPLFFAQIFQSVVYWH